jgi:thioesterase domain-containing protein
LQKGILTRDGVEVLKRALCANALQLVVSPEDLGHVLKESWVARDSSGAFSVGTGRTLAQTLVDRIGVVVEEPHNEVERALADIWSAVLGIAPIGHHENFFDLGGHSLLAMQVVSQIRNTFHVHFSLRYFFAKPTLNGMAGQISALVTRQKEPEEIAPGAAAVSGNAESGNNLRAHKTTGRKPELIQLHAGNSGPQLFFLIDEGSLGLFKLAHAMDDDLPMYASVVPLPDSALKASMDKQSLALPSMEDLAADHVALIMSHPINGPVLLAGHCFGGNLAFEVAQQLQRAGKEVEAVLMLNTWMTEPNFWWQKKVWLQAHFRKLMQQGSLYLWKKSLRRINLEKDRLASRLELAVQDDFTVHVPWVIIERIYRHALETYRPQMLASRGLLLISQDDWLSNAYRQMDDSLGVAQWFAGGVDVLDVSGDHVTVLDELHLPELAKRFQNALDKLRLNDVRLDGSTQPANEARI